MARTTTNISEALTKRLDARCQDGESRASRLENDLAAYYVLLQTGMVRARRALSPNEAKFVLALQSSGVADILGRWLNGGLVNQVLDACELDGIHQDYDVAPDVLVAKLREIGDAGQLALVDWAARIWARHESTDFDAEAAVFKGA